MSISASEENISIDLAFLQQELAAEGLKNDKDGLVCDLHTWDARTNSRGETQWLQTGWQYEEDAESDDEVAPALNLTRFWSDKQSLSRTELEVRSPYLVEAIRNVIKEYPGIKINGADYIVIYDQPRCLFHYRNELHEFAKQAAKEKPQAAEHMSFCLKYVARALQKERRQYSNLMANSTHAPGLAYDILWMAYKPGTLIYSCVDNADRLYRLVSFSSPGSFRLERVEYNGKTFGYIHHTGRIDRYEGYRPFTQLEFFPLFYHPKKAQIRQRLMERGRKYVSLRGIHYKDYKGQLDVGPRHRRYPDDDESEDDEFDHGEDSIVDAERETIHERIMVDCTQYYRQAAWLMHDRRLKKTEIDKAGDPVLSNEDLLICTSLVRGFSLKRMRWNQFDVANISNVDRNEKAFHSLVLSEEKKKMMVSLVKMEHAATAHFDDLIKGKGRGIVFLLHGLPGVGKTFTAESIADFTKRPLYMIGCSDLTHDPVTAEEKLSTALALAKRWRAITLIDEADVFMAERNVHDLGRNELVSVLLRQMEYFDGILFLTTNRVDAIDSAFMSRVHLSIAYPSLSPLARRELWKTFLRRDAADGDMAWTDNEFLDEISAIDINGRRIKNAVRVAHALAANEQRKLQARDLRSVLAAVQTFADDFQQQNKKRLSGATDDNVHQKRRKV